MSDYSLLLFDAHLDLAFNALQLNRDITQPAATVRTHDPVAASYTDRILFLADGRIVDELREPDRESVLERMGRLQSAAVPPQAG